MARPIAAACKYGHPRTEENAYYQVVGERKLRQCRVCREARHRRVEPEGFEAGPTEARSAQLLEMARQGLMREPGGPKMDKWEKSRRYYRKMVSDPAKREEIRRKWRERWRRRQAKAKAKAPKGKRRRTYL